MSELLKMEKITKKFGDMFANKNVNLCIFEGEVHTLLGENGAGKSTLMNILMGIYEPTSGSIYLNGAPVKIDSPAKAMELGIGMVHQHFMLVEAMTVFENMILGADQHHQFFLQRNKKKKEIQQISKKYQLDVDLDKQITELSVGEQQRVEILKALYKGARLLILDEPTAALTDIEVTGLFTVIKRLKEENKSIIFISHKMREVLEISDRITILRSGETIETKSRVEATAENLASSMIGKELVISVVEKLKKTNDVLVSMEKISYNKTSKHRGVCQISLQVKEGEIFGIAGVDGNGQSQLAQLLTGVIQPDEGEIRLGQEIVTMKHANEFIQRGVSHIPEDRNKMGLIGNMSVSENLILKKLDSPQLSKRKGWYLRKKEIEKYAKELKIKYDIRCTSILQEARNLSGGNQQKIILARELERKPKLLVAVHPTRGLDIGATGYVHEQMIKARDQGSGVVLITADFDEVLKLSDRIGVMYEGKLVGIFDGNNPPIEEISLAMAGKTGEKVKE